eukprot:m.97484 g.97484  ORF g.97484 m.97484 type:complete len:185 (-) comp13103_c0_seq1:7420-7974(-)
MDQQTFHPTFTLPPRIHTHVTYPLKQQQQNRMIRSRRQAMMTTMTQTATPDVDVPVEAVVTGFSVNSFELVVVMVIVDVGHWIVIESEANTHAFESSDSMRPCVGSRAAAYTSKVNSKGAVQLANVMRTALGDTPSIVLIAIGNITTWLSLQGVAVANFKVPVIAGRLDVFVPVNIEVKSDKVP